jgi:tRNA(His) 5'-end guanylyltransferase
MSDKTSLGDRIKAYEHDYEQRLMPYVPTIIRIDGRAFHTWTNGCKKPYDTRLVESFVEATKLLVKETSAKIGYTQSDEITLVLYQNSYQTQQYFGGRVQKICSILASYTSTHFWDIVKHKFDRGPCFPNRMLRKPFPTFDCRVFSVPSKIEACNVLLWREQDAVRNSIQSLGQAHFSHKQIQNKSCPEIQDMLHEKNINWNDEPYYFKRGSWIYKKQTGISPPTYIGHATTTANSWETQPLRTEIISEEIPIFSSITNKEEFVFDNKKPILEK